MTAQASDEELLRLLREDRGGGNVVGLSRRPYRYATSAPLEELRVSIEGGGEMALIFKDLDRDRLVGKARATKPSFLHEPSRELETYRQILAPAGIGPRCAAVVADAEPPRHWLLIERVPGVELWQVGELEVWEEVAKWLAGFHARFSGQVKSLPVANPYLLDVSEAWFRSWCDRAKAALDRSSDRRAPSLRRALDGYEEVVVPLAALPRTLVHGEFYPSNVLVVPDQQPLRVCPVDWEMAAVGTGLIDLAALVGGWGASERRRLVSAYCDGAREARAADPGETVGADLARCRLHLALQWLGWSGDWSPPKEHAHDWVGEALALARELALA